jgi:hypothetical protein
MHGNVDDPLTITGDELMVCGPIVWNGDQPGDVPATSVEVRSVKVVRVDPDTGALGPQIGSFNSTVPFPAGVEDWMVNVQVSPEEPLQPGDVVRVAVQALARLQNGGARSETWDHQVSITDVPEAGGGGAAPGP